MRRIPKHRYKRWLFLMAGFFCFALSLQAISRVDSLVMKLEKGGLADSVQVALKLKISDAYVNQDFTKAYAYVSDALNQAKQIKYGAGYRNALNRMGTLYYQISKYDSSIYYLEMALTEAKMVNDEGLQADVLNNLGNNYLDLSQFNLALDYYTKGLVFIRKMKRISSEAPVLANIGIIYHTKEQYDKALEFHNKALEIYRLLKASDEELSISYLEIAELYIKKKNLALANIYIDSAEERIHGENDLYPSMLANRMKGDLKMEQKSYKLAIVYYNKSIELANQMGYERGAVDTKNKLAQTYLDNAEYIKAEKVALDANEGAFRLKIFEQLTESELILSKIYTKLSNPAEAYIHLERHRIYIDSLHNSEKNNLLLEMQTRFASQEKEFENDQLRKQQVAKDERIALQRNMLYLIVAASILLLAFSIYEFIQYRKKQQLNNELVRLNEDISKQKEELEVQAIELSKLSKEIEEKNKLLEVDNRKKDLSIRDKEKRILDFAFFNAHELRASVARILGLVNIFKHSFYEKEELDNIVNMVEQSTLSLDVIVKDFGNRLINIEAEDKEGEEEGEERSDKDD